MKKQGVEKENFNEVKQGQLFVQELLRWNLNDNNRQMPWKGENIYIRGFGSFITKKRAAKIGRNIKKNIAVHIPEHHIPAFKPAKEFVADVKKTAVAN